MAERNEMALQGTRKQKGAPKSAFLKALSLWVTSCRPLSKKDLIIIETWTLSSKYTPTYTLKCQASLFNLFSTS